VHEYAVYCRLDKALRALSCIAFVALVALVVAGCATTRAPVVSGQPFVEEGLATFYGREAHGGPTASGERFDMHALTAAHRRLPFGTVVDVVNLRNGRRVSVRINDRGPYGRGRIIDVSLAAARRLEMVEAGVVPVRISARP
jgi:rare lipoprotein A